MTDANESFEKAARIFHKVTGNLPPGKDGCPREPDGELREDVARDWRIWCAAVDYMRGGK